MARDQPDVQLGAKPPAGRNWADLRLRVASAAILAPLTFICIWIGGWPWDVLLGLGAVGLAVEWVQLCGGRVLSPPGGAAVAVVLAAVLGAMMGLPLGSVLVLAGGAACLAFASRALAFGVVYVGLPLVALVWLRADPVVGLENFLLMVLVVWATDIGAYLAGRLLGGPKLAPRISPGKTWSGAAGGLLAAILVGLATAPWAAAVAAALSVVAQAGDLLESGIKRHFRVKDSGWLIPGHGGLLDRLDGVLAAALLTAALAYGVGRGVLIWR